ncbi:MAG: hypoxanthine phosphoribosyltransferase [Phycisphaerales bacterium]|nr:hypoxanthine phosphoribosyltransferase [Phycisphaerales bacterium]
MNSNEYPEGIKVLIDEERIAERVARLAKQLEEDLDALQGPVTLVPVMTGSMLFTSDLIRHLQRPLRIAPVTVQSYPGSSTRSRGARLQTPIPDALKDTHVVIIDDILDSGGTLAVLRRLMKAVGPASVRACVLLRKNVEHDITAICEYTGFDIPDRFVVGYGLDYDGLYRNLPFIGTLPEHLIGVEDAEA